MLAETGSLNSSVMSLWLHICVWNREQNKSYVSLGTVYN